MKRNAVLLFTIALLACSLFQKIEWVAGSFETALEGAMEQKKATLVYFYSPAAEPCARLDKEFFGNRQVAALIERRYVPFKSTEGAGDDLRLRQFFQISVIPTLVVLGTDGVERDRIVGYNGNAREVKELLEDWAAERNSLFIYLRRWGQDTTDVEWNYQIARRYLARGQPELADKYFARVLRHDPRNVAGYNAEARFQVALSWLRRTGEEEPLRLVLRHERDRQRLIDGYSALAAANESRALQGDEEALERAVDVYREAFRKIPDSAELYKNCALFLRKARARRHLDFALEAAQKAAELQPKDDGIWDNLAWLYHAAGRHDDATAAMKKAVRLSPKSEAYRQALLQMQREAEKAARSSRETGSKY